MNRDKLMLIDGLGGSFELSGWMEGSSGPGGGHPPLLEMHACVKRGFWSQGGLSAPTSLMQGLSRLTGSYDRQH